MFPDFESWEGEDVGQSIQKRVEECVALKQTCYVLLLGESDFSFAEGLARWASLSITSRQMKLVATSQDTPEEVRELVTRIDAHIGM